MGIGLETGGFATIACNKCKTSELRPRSPSTLDRITSFYPFKCARCGHNQQRFRFKRTGVQSTFIVGAVLVGGWLWMNPPSVLSFSGGNPANGATLAQKEQAEALARARAAIGGELSNFEQLMLRKSKPAMDNATVLKLVKANVDKSVILQLIQTSSPDYDLSADAIIAMKQAGLSESILLAMINVSYGIR
jgi:hypothetical protein